MKSIYNSFGYPESQHFDPIILFAERLTVMIWHFVRMTTNQNSLAYLENKFSEYIFRPTRLFFMTIPCNRMGSVSNKGNIPTNIIFHFLG